MKLLMAVCLVALCGTSVASSQVRHAHDLQLSAMSARASDLAEELRVPRAWVGYSVTRRMYSNSYFGWYGRSGATLGELLQDASLEQDQAVHAAARRALNEREDSPRLVEKTLGVLFRIAARDGSEGVIDDVRVVTFDTTPGLDDAPLLWLGPRSNDESLEFLTALAAESRSSLREDLIGAIGAHDAPATVIPYLIRIIENDKDDDVRETAGQWLAARVADERGFFREGDGTDDEAVRRSALYALINSDTGDATEILLRILQTSDSPALKRAALMQLPQVDDGRGLPALVQLARDG